MNINLHIERLVLEGVKILPGQRYLLQAHVITKLARMLKEGALSNNFAQDNVVPRVSTGGIQLTIENDSSQLGQQIAQAVYEGIGHE